MSDTDKSRAHLRAHLWREFAKIADKVGLNPQALDDVADRAARSGAYGLRPNGDLDLCAGESPESYARRLLPEAPHFAARPHGAPPPRVGGKAARIDAKGRRRTAAELLELANGEGAQ